MIDVGRYPASQTIVGRILRAPLRLIPRESVVRILQGPIRGKRWITGSGIDRLWLGSYEPSKMRLASTWVSPADVVFDIGANVGIYTLLFSERVGSRGCVVAFEPSPRNIGFLRRHLDLNLAANVVVVEAAVIDNVGVARFDTADTASTGHLSPDGGFDVATITIDDFVESTGHVPSHLKIDVEGAEVGVLRGAEKTLKRHRPQILLATHSAALKHACTELLNACDYDVQELKDGGYPVSDELSAFPRDGR
jgi:FkbM family methyltransferase